MIPSITDLYNMVFTKTPSQTDMPAITGFKPLDPNEFVVKKPPCPRELYENRVRGNARKTNKRKSK